jgi:hypothetical protein
VVTAALTAKGMVQDESHHHMFRKTIGGVTTLVTRMSLDDREINDTLAVLMARQCCLYLREFWQLVDCPLTTEQWDALVRERCSGGRNPFINK